MANAPYTQFTPEEAKMHGDAMREHCIKEFIEGFRRNPGMVQEIEEMFAAMRADNFNPPDDGLEEALRRYKEETK